LYTHTTHPTMPLLLLSYAPVPPFLYTLSLHDALPIFVDAIAGDAFRMLAGFLDRGRIAWPTGRQRRITRRPETFDPGDSATVEEIGRATSELQSPYDIVCRLLLEKKKRTNKMYSIKYT